MARSSLSDEAVRQLSLGLTPGQGVASAGPNLRGPRPSSSSLPSPALTATSSTIDIDSEPRSTKRRSRTLLASSSASSEMPSTPPTSSPGSAPSRSHENGAHAELDDGDAHPLLPAPRIHIEGLSLSPLPRILIIDHFDSYTRNLVPLLLAASSPTSAATHDATDRIVVLPYTSPALHPSNFPSLAAEIDAILISPGPGHPASAVDFGPSGALLQGMKDGSLPVIPVLGVCLGFQGMAVLEGAKLQQGQGAHGLRCSLEWTEEEGQRGIYKGLDQARTEVVRYNSLVLVDEDLPLAVIPTSWSSTDLPTAPDPSPEALSLLTSPAFTSRRPCSANDSSTPRPHRIVMSLRHSALPFVGVQYHPESIESQFGHAIIANWITEVWSWWDKSEGGRGQRRSDAASDLPKPLPRWMRLLDTNFAQAPAAAEVKPDGPFATLDFAGLKLLDAGTAAQNPQLAIQAFWTLFLRRGWAAIGQEGSDGRAADSGGEDGCVWLDSARARDPQSQYSYMARPSFWLAYDVSTRNIVVRTRCQASASTASPWNSSRLALHEGETFWSFVDDAQRALQAQMMPSDDREGEGHARGRRGPPPFRAGFVGFWGYEMHRESLPPQDHSALVKERGREDLTPTAVQALADSELGWVDSVLQVDHGTGEWHGCALVKAEEAAGRNLDEASALGRLQRAVLKAGGSPDTLLGQPRETAQASLADLREKILALANGRAPVAHPPTPTPVPPLAPLDSAELYQAKVEGARSAISKGDSYELCLTTHFTGRTSGASPEADGPCTTSEHFSTYLSLRSRNPAPYAAFVSLPRGEADGEARTLLSTSPERFISLSSSGIVEMRPIKGTVPRAGYDKGEEHMRASMDPEADQREEEVQLGWREKEDAKRRNRLECDAKERAENLMIVDLIRSDLLTFCSAPSVVVPRLMHVESYETLHQLVTTVRGLKLDGVGALEGVRRAFPPGSMTGAPKVRSVELLELLEKEVGRLGDEEAKAEPTMRRRGPYSGALGWCDVGGAACYSVIIRTLVAHGRDLTAGAGGAVTYLSKPQREWKECCDKVRTLAEVKGIE